MGTIKRCCGATVIISSHLNKVQSSESEEKLFKVRTPKQILLAVLLFQLLFLRSVNGDMALNPFCDQSCFIRPSRLLDQHFGLGLEPEDLLTPLVLPRLLLRSPTGYLRPWRTEASQGDTGSTVSFDKDRFQANLDVQQFKPEEITVKLTGDNSITVEGKHEEKQDEHGYISRHFVRRYVLPKNCDTNQLQSKLSSDGILTITAPTVDAKQIEHKEIPIQLTGEPAKQIENKKSGQSNEP